MLDFARHFAIAFSSNYSEFPNTCPSFQFPFGKDAFEVLIDGWNSNLKQVSDEHLRQPDGLILKPAL